MTWATAAAIVGSAVVGGVASGSAASRQASAYGSAIDEQRRQYDLTRADFAPWREQGLLALMSLANYLGLNQGRGPAPVAPTREQFMRMTGTGGYIEPGTGAWRSGQESVFDEAAYNEAMRQYQEDLTAYQSAQSASTSPEFGSLLTPFTGESLATEPGYQFGLAEGEKAIDRAARGRTGIDSGATLKALLRFNEDYAGTKYNEGFNRDLLSKQNIYNMLAGISGTGQTATSQVASAGQNSANNIAALLGQQGNARAAGIVGGANAWNSAVGNWLGYQQNQNMWNYLNAGRTPSASGTPFGY